VESATPLVKVTLKARKDLLPAVAQFVHQLALANGLSKDEARRLELIAEEASVNVIQHALEGNPESTFDVLVERRPAQFVLAVEDQGLPFDWRKCESGESLGLGLRLMRAMSDEIHFLNLGRNGKRLEFIKNLFPTLPRDAEVEQPAPPETDTQTFPADLPITIRFLRPDEGVALARCLYRSYGFSYKEYAYYPERVREQIESGLQDSLVAEIPGGELVAHLALVRPYRGALVAEIGQAGVDPRCRGRKLFENMKKKFVEHARDTGMLGLYSEAIAIHGFTQKGNHALGATETGVVPGYGPDNIVYKKINENLPQRFTVVLFYLRVNEEPEREVFPPYHHRTIIGKIYEYGKFRRRLAPVKAIKTPKLPPNCELDVHFNTDFKMAVMTVKKYGEDTADVVRVRLRELCLHGVECILLQLPLCDPATPKLCGSLEAVGFAFTGIIPEYDNGDVMCLIYLNNIALDPSKAVIVSDFARELFHYALSGMGIALPPPPPSPPKPPRSA
jgi:serine/threonine-protein kinase RsbW